MTVFCVHYVLLYEYSKRNTPEAPEELNMTTTAPAPFITRFARNLAKRHGITVGTVVEIADDLGLSVYWRWEGQRGEWIIDEPRHVLLQLDRHIVEMTY